MEQTESLPEQRDVLEDYGVDRCRLSQTAGSKVGTGDLLVLQHLHEIVGEIVDKSCFGGVAAEQGGSNIRVFAQAFEGEQGQRLHLPIVAVHVSPKTRQTILVRGLHPSQRDLDDAKEVVQSALVFNKRSPCCR